MTFTEDYYESDDLNWNDMTNSQQQFLEERLISSEVLTRCSELIDDAYQKECCIKEHDLKFSNMWYDPAPEGDEQYEKDISSYFIITEWLSSELDAIGGCVAMYKGLHIWGRIESGQGLAMNHELKEIARKVKPLKISV